MIDDKTLIEQIEPLINGLGLELLEASFKKGPGTGRLLVIVDHKNFSQGVRLQDCEAVSRALDTVVETIDFGVPFDLEVSSPGTERPLRTDEHFQWALGKEVVVHTKPRQRGILRGISADKITLENKAGETVAVERVKCHQIRDFDMSKASENGEDVHEL